MHSLPPFVVEDHVLKPNEFGINKHERRKNKKAGSKSNRARKDGSVVQEIVCHPSKASAPNHVLIVEKETTAIVEEMKAKPVEIQQ